MTKGLKDFMIERPHHYSGIQRLYDLGNGYGLSLINGPEMHIYPYAWEAAVVTGIKPNGDFDDLSYDTPLADDVVVFSTEEEADEFIQKAFEWAAQNPKPLDISRHLKF